jgi:hypothetical protein
MMLRASSVRTHRPIFWILFTVSVIAPVAFFIYTTAAHNVPGWFINTSMKTWFASLTLLCVWSVVCARDEPKLVRIALCWIAFHFFMLALGSGALIFNARL